MPVAGTTVVAGADRVVRYTITKPLGTVAGVSSGTDRIAALRKRVEVVRSIDAGDAYRVGASDDRLQLRMTALHELEMRGGPT